MKFAHHHRLQNRRSKLDSLFCSGLHEQFTSCLDSTTSTASHNSATSSARRDRFLEKISLLSLQVLRERPPPIPPRTPAEVVEKVLPAPPQAPRRVVVERFGSCPPKPADVIIERWLPYKAPPERSVLLERAPSTQMYVVSLSPKDFHLDCSLQSTAGAESTDFT